MYYFLSSSDRFLLYLSALASYWKGNLPAASRLLQSAAIILVIICSLESGLALERIGYFLRKYNIYAVGDLPVFDSN